MRELPHPAHLFKHSLRVFSLPQDLKFDFSIISENNNNASSHMGLTDLGVDDALGKPERYTLGIGIGFTILMGIG